jgi:hypothetical protein
VAQVVERLPSNEALSSTPSITKEKERKEGREGERPRWGGGGEGGRREEKRSENLQALIEHW